MNAERLLALYEKVAEAPDVIVRLRRFVLDLAVRGKLVAQDAGNVSPFKLLADARKELRAQAETAKRMRWKQTDPVATNEIDKDVPSGWMAARVNDTGLYINGLAFKPADWRQSGIPIIRIQNLTDPQKEFNYAHGDFPDEVMVRDGDLLVSWSATLEAFKWNRGEGVLNQHIFRVIPHEGLTDRGFLLLLLRHAIREMADSEHAHGLVMAHINRGPFLNHVVLIPPLAEQRRIVAKVEELMALLDRLEAARSTREAIRDRLSAASFSRLTSSDADPAEFPDNARFALDALPSLTARPDQIKLFRQIVLNLAVRGKLVEQDPADEPASELLKRLKKAQISAIASEGIRARSPIAKLSRVDMWFDFPESWALPSFDEIFVIVSGVTKGQKILRSEAVDTPYLRVANVQRGHLDLSVIKNITVRKADEKRYALRSGDILMTEGGDWDKLGRAAIWHEEIPGCIHQNHIFRVRTPSSDVSPEWVITYVNSLLGRAFFEDASKQTTNLASINMTQLRGCPIPLPPLAEQHRIVAKVDALMAVCDRLEAALAQADTTRARLLEALLPEALLPGMPKMAAAE